MKILLEAGADVEHQNENGHTPLMEAASCGHVGMLYVELVCVCTSLVSRYICVCTLSNVMLRNGGCRVEWVCMCVV